MLPDSRILYCRRKQASRKEATKLKMAAGTGVIRIERVRNFSAKPTMIETITLPARPFRGLDDQGRLELPDTLYELYDSQ